MKRLANQIANSGIKHVFGIPGSGSTLDLLNELHKRSVEFHLTHFEGSAAIMAGVMGRQTGKAGIAISIKGPGLANMIPGMAVCMLEEFPMVAISEAYHPDVTHAKSHKRMDHASLTLPVSKGKRFWATEGPSFYDMSKWAESDPPRPVHLDIPGQVLDKETPTPSVNKVKKNSNISQLISKSIRPVVIVGSQGMRIKWNSLLNHLRIPVFSTATAKGIVDETHVHAAGVYTGTGKNLVPENTIFEKADLVIFIGVKPNELLSLKKYKCDTIAIDFSPNVFDLEHFGHRAITDVEQGEELVEELTRKEWGLKELIEIKDHLNKHLFDERFLPASLFSAIQNRFEYEVRLVLDTGYFATIGEHAWMCRKPELYVASGNGRYMGASIPMGIAASLHDRSVPTVVAVGDGGIGPFVSELKIAAENRLPLIVILMSDGGLGSIRTRAIKCGLTQEYLCIRQPSWIDTIKSFGLETRMVSNLAHFQDCIKNWNLSKGPLFLEAGFDPGEYQSMVEGIR